MASYMHIPARWLGGFLAIALAACAGQQPSVAVLGVSPPKVEASRPDEQVLLVFVEVHNPTNRDLKLSRLEYRLEARAWFESAGKVAVRRAVAAGSSAVVEIPVPVRPGADVEDGVAYTLEGRLFAHENDIERSWQVAVEGAFVRDRRGALLPTRARVAGAVRVE